MGEGQILTVTGVYVGTPEPIGEVAGQAVTSAIRKRPAHVPELMLGAINLEGDDQADRVDHGGPDKAIYMYPAEHYPGWNADGFPVSPGGLGENVDTLGATEDTVRIGDVFRWGDALVQVSQPRTPCYKLQVHLGRKDVTKTMIVTARCGWYMRVLEPGVVPTRGEVVLVERDDTEPTVAEAFRTSYARPPDIDGLRRLARSRAMAEQFRNAIVAGLAMLEAS